MNFFDSPKITITPQVAELDEKRIGVKYANCYGNGDFIGRCQIIERTPDNQGVVQIIMPDQRPEAYRHWKFITWIDLTPYDIAALEPATDEEYDYILHWQPKQYTYIPTDYFTEVEQFKQQLITCSQKFCLANLPNVSMTEYFFEMDQTFCQWWQTSASVAPLRKCIPTILSIITNSDRLLREQRLPFLPSFTFMLSTNAHFHCQTKEPGFHFAYSPVEGDGPNRECYHSAAEAFQGYVRYRHRYEDGYLTIFSEVYSISVSESARNRITACGYTIEEFQHRERREIEHLMDLCTQENIAVYINESPQENFLLTYQDGELYPSPAPWRRLNS
jgi:hypothetical protein